ncbi:MAG: DUF1566 domain-containing protein [Methylococcaceae bacterium]
MVFIYRHISLLFLVIIVIIEAGLISRVEAGVPFLPSETLWVQVGIGSDDAEENVPSGSMSLTSTDLELIQDGTKQQKVGLRFPLEIPPGATIKSATLQFTADEISTEPTTLSVYGEATSNALTFSNARFDISNRTLTAANVTWTPSSWTIKNEAGPDQQTPDLSVIVQEVVDQGGWVQGNYIAFIISGNGKREAESFNGTAAPVLHVEYSTLPPDPMAPVAEDDDTFAAPGYTIGVDQQLTVLNGADDIVERNDRVGFPAAVVTTFGPVTGLENNASTLGVSAQGGDVVVRPDGGFTYTPATSFMGVDSFSYNLMNSEGSDSAIVYISVEEVVNLTPLWISVIRGSDDAEENTPSGRMSLTSTDLELTQDGTKQQKIGIRFQGVDIPLDATIVNAYIQFTSDELSTDPTQLIVRGEANPNASTFTSTPLDISNRPLTVAQVSWEPAPWTTIEQSSDIQATPNLSAIVQEVKDQAGWAQGNSIVFIISGDGKRIAESYNGTAAPMLHLTYSTEPSANEAPTAVDDGVSESPAYTIGINQQLIMPSGPEDIVERNDTVGFPVAVVSTFGPVIGLETNAGTLGTSAAGGALNVAADGSFIYTPAPGYLGPDSFSYALTNSEGSETATVHIEVLNIGVENTLWIPVAIGSDDAEEDVIGGGMDLTSSDLEMILDRSSMQLVGVRFQGIDVPSGAVIESATIQYTVDENTTEPAQLTVHGEASLDALTFTRTKFDISTRPLTAALVEWTPPAWPTRGASAQDQETPDLSEIVQEIVDQPGWAEGNSMVFITSGSGNRVAESFNGTAAPELHLVYSLAPPTSTVKLNDTGITTCSDATNNGLPCPVAGFPGQDGEYGRDVTHNDDSDGHAGFSYTKLDGDGNPLPASATAWDCVKDNVTGLIWEVKTDDGGLRDKDNRYTWYEPDNSKNGGFAGIQNGGSCTGSNCDTQSYVQAVNALGLCGMSEWRMPNRNELVSIVNNARYDPAIDTNYFSNGLASYFWSSSPNVFPWGAWGVDFEVGYVSDGNKTGNGFYVRLVRGG